jgi:very-short-patch-repair endonuclease
MDANHPLTNQAKNLRTNQTEAELRLWYHLRAKRFMGLKFKRQKPIGPFIADFACMELHLIIEADGSQHGGVDDHRRDDWFASQGFRVLRFWNHEILGQTEAVLERIRDVAYVLSAEPSPPTPLPQAGEGSKKSQPQ